MDPSLPPPNWENTQMWEKLTPDDIAQAKHKLSSRVAMLSRHAAELVLDAQQQEIDQFEHLVEHSLRST